MKRRNKEQEQIFFGGGGKTVKKRKRGDMRRAASVFLSAMLVAGMLSGAIPAEVLAKENGDPVENVEEQENISGGAAEVTGSEAVTQPGVEPETKPGEGEAGEKPGGENGTEPGAKPGEGEAGEKPGGETGTEPGAKPVEGEDGEKPGDENGTEPGQETEENPGEEAESQGKPGMSPAKSLEEAEPGEEAVAESGRIMLTAEAAETEITYIEIAQTGAGGTLEDFRNGAEFRERVSVTAECMSDGETIFCSILNKYSGWMKEESGGYVKFTGETWEEGTYVYEILISLTSNGYVFPQAPPITDRNGEVWTVVGLSDDKRQITLQSGIVVKDFSHTHSWSSDWTTNETHHWHECTVPGCQAENDAEKDAYGEHVYDDAGSTKCNICGYVRTVAHVHKLQMMPEVPATCTQAGYKAYYVCGGDGGCGKWFSDGAGTQEITDKDSLIIPALGHSIVYLWEQGETTHYNICERCGSRFDEAAHTEDKGEVTTKPTESADGLRTYCCTVCGKTLRTEVIPALGDSHTHKYTILNYNVNGHWYECMCGEVSDAGSRDHTPGKRTEPGVEATCMQEGTSWTVTFCTECGYEWSRVVQTVPKTDHIRDGGTVTKQPTATEAGIRAYQCRMCGKAMGTETIPATGSGDNTGNGDGESGNGSGDSSGGDSDNSSGNGSGGSNGGNGAGGDNSGSGTADGTQGGDNQGSISDGESKNAGTGNTPATAAPAGTGQPRVKQEKEGNVQKEVSVTGENTLDASVAMPVSELAGLVLTEAEKQQAADGTAIQIVLDMKDAFASVSGADKVLVEAALSSFAAKGYTLGQYLDINLFKVVGDSRSAVTQTKGKINVIINVPDSLKNTDGARTRTYAVIRVHDGRAELLPDLDSNSDTITIATDRFSTYAIVYKDTAGKVTEGVNLSADGGSVTVNAQSESGRKSVGAKDDEPKTGDDTPIELWATVSMIAGLTYLLLYFADYGHGMTEETKKEIVSSIIGWAKKGGRMRRLLALGAIFAVLVYYHSIGKKMRVEWEEWTA